MYIQHVENSIAIVLATILFIILFTTEDIVPSIHALHLVFPVEAIASANTAHASCL